MRVKLPVLFLDGQLSAALLSWHHAVARRRREEDTELHASSNAHKILAMWLNDRRGRHTAIRRRRAGRMSHADNLLKRLALSSAILLEAEIRSHADG
jgi:hypothetical protein